ncbi:hypothetical protein TNCV_143651 [Trichonephila clavipes]|nr:hypothetical protein TNCV_143651 [Trichonephila clavipes]
MEGEQVYPTQWQEAIVIPILKPGKDPKNPAWLSTDSTHESCCLCLRHYERVVNAPSRLSVKKRTNAFLCFRVASSKGKIHSRQYYYTRKQNQKRFVSEESSF